MVYHSQHKLYVEYTVVGRTVWTQCFSHGTEMTKFLFYDFLKCALFCFRLFEVRSAWLCYVICTWSESLLGCLTSTNLESDRSQDKNNLYLMIESCLFLGFHLVVLFSCQNWRHLSNSVLKWHLEITFNSTVGGGFEVTPECGFVFCWLVGQLVCQWFICEPGN